MSYQKCPICGGQGEIFTAPAIDATSLTKFPQTCKVCKGAGIISEVTGLPPQYADQKKRNDINVFDLGDVAKVTRKKS